MNIETFVYIYATNIFEMFTFVLPLWKGTPNVSNIKYGTFFHKMYRGSIHDVNVTWGIKKTSIQWSRSQT